MASNRQQSPRLWQVVPIAQPRCRSSTRHHKAAITKVLNATWQRCRVHFMRNALAHAGKSGRRVVSAFIATAFAQDDAAAASAQWLSLQPVRTLAEAGR